ncbi:hypothetical protein EYR36_007602 [Pleurotus pulmonarius]|nr:hypothetical protein EYR36_007602 [Pleurotus pulmonarius]
MSRAPPFPTRRARSPSLTNGNSQQSSTKPLQIGRLPSRPTTPSNGSSHYVKGPTGSPNSNSSGPSRPQRSEFRSRQSGVSDVPSDYSRDYYRDSMSTTRSDVSTPHRPRPSTSNTPGGPRPPPPRSARGLTEDEATSPTLASAISAFQFAGVRKRAMTNGSDDLNYERERQQEIEEDKARQKRIRDKMPGRQPTSARTGEIDAVLDQVKDGWEFMVDDDFNTVDLALQLLDDTNVGKDMESFRRTKHLLAKALKGSVDKHYKQFADSLPHHAALLTHLTATQSQIKETRTLLQEAKESLGNKRSDLVQLWSRGQTLEEMMRLLDQIEHLKAVPDLLETLISEKRLLQASVLLVRSLKMINKADMQEIGAVSDLRSYLVAQETALRDILVDELHGHLYLKSFWCESRWAAYVPNQDVRLPKVEFDEDPDNAPPPGTQTDAAAPAPSRMRRYLNDLAIRPNDPPLDINEPNLRGPRTSTSLSTISNLVPGAVSQSSQTNPEADSFIYMETVMESLAVLGKLGNALDNVAQRLPTEVYSLVEATLDEVSERAEFGRRLSMQVMPASSIAQADGVYLLSNTLSGVDSVLNTGSVVDASALRLAGLESSARQLDHEILKDFFWTVYSKLHAVAQGLRVVYEVANRIGSRRDFKDASGAKAGSLFPLSEIWTAVQSEVRTLISDYITDEEQGTTSGRNPVSSINEILRDGRFTRDKTKTIFRFVDTDVKSTIKTLKPYEDGLMGMIKDTMPGLVQGSSDNPTQSIVSNVGSDDRLLGTGQRHRILIHPDAFHVTILFRPTLCFLDRVAEVLPFGTEASRASSEVLDDFVLKVYLPQLEEKVSSLFHEIVIGPEAFQPDPFSARLSNEPLLKASVQLMALINSLCTMLQTSPFHRENYTRLILGVIIQFYQRCSDRFQDLVSVAPPTEMQLEPKLSLAAQWAQRSELAPCLNDLVQCLDLEKKNQLCRQEIQLELGFLGQADISQDDLIPSLRSVASLCTLHRSVMWFGTALTALKAKTEGAPMSPQNLEPLSAMTPFTPLLPVLPPISSDDSLKLALSKEMALRFQALLKTYEQLAELVLYTIRIDIRCRVIHHLSAAFQNGNYDLERESTQPDSNIAKLNAELTQFEEMVSSRLSKEAHNFAFSGLSSLLEHLLVSNARHLRRVNSFGIKKILRNIQALQQNIKAITFDGQVVDFSRPKQYYSLFSISPQDMLESIRQKAVFTFEEYQTMLNLQCGVVTADGEAGIARALDRNYGMYMIELHGLEIGS